MNNPKANPNRPPNYQDLVKKYRKVQPVTLTSSLQKSQTRTAPTSGIETYTGTWGDDKIMHLLRRSLFGVRKSDLQSFRGLDLAQAVNSVLTKNDPPSPPINDYNITEESLIDPDVPFGETWINAPHGGDFEGGRVVSLKTWLIQNVINQSPNIEEKLLFFWHNLLPTKAWDVFYGKLSYDYFSMLRSNMFGNYKTMIRSLTLDPAMLIFLNGASSNKDAPDENYGRELQELFCIGKGPNAQFTEADVQAAARLLTGWGFDWEAFEETGNLNTKFNTWGHDTEDKQFSSFYNDKLIEGKTGEAGAEELDELLDMIFENEEVSLYICRRLYSFFVYHEADQTVEENVIVPLAKIFRDNNYEIMPVLEKLLSSAHFFDEANRGAMIKSPQEFNLGLWRTLEMKGLDSNDIVDLKDQHTSLLWSMSGQGLEIADPPSVSGWPAYYQTPSFDKYWITTDTISTRGQVTDSMIFWGLWFREGAQIAIDLIAFIQLLDEPEDANKMLCESSLLLHGIKISDEGIASLKAILLSGQSDDLYWTNAWSQLMSDPDNIEYRMVVENRLKSTFQHLLQLGETHLF